MSKLWGEAFYQANLARHHNTDKRTWSMKLVMAILNYRLSLWKYRCALLHGRTLEEGKALQIRHLASQVTAAYDAYKLDPHVIHYRVHHLFDVPLHQRLRQDKDSRKCFLSTFKRAKDAQDTTKKKMAVVAKTFFCPKQDSCLASLSTCNPSPCIPIQS